jgi:hypothetical protein
MREITSHIVNPANDKIRIAVTDAPGSGGANHRYEIAGFDTATNHSLASGGVEPKDKTVILFQNGPIAEAGINGVTQEVLLAIVADRLQCFQAGPYASDLNAKALEHVNAAQEALLSRTRERMARGVEGTHAK